MTHPFDPVAKFKYFLVISQDWHILQGYVATLQTNKQTPWPLVRKRTIPTERPPLVGEI
jgi:hypothetical protein